jgi:hypothetical protein
MPTKKTSIGSKSIKKNKPSNKYLKNKSGYKSDDICIDNGSKKIFKDLAEDNTTVNKSKSKAGINKKTISRSKSVDSLDTNNKSTKNLITCSKIDIKTSISDSKNKPIKKLSVSSMPATNIKDKDPGKKIKLGGKKGGFALVSKEDYDELSKYSWHKNNNGYVQGHVNRKSISMHRFILKPNDNHDVDHINHIRTDNRRSNLRIASRLQNNQNLSKRKNTLSKYRGVTYDKNRKKYVVFLTSQGKKNYLGAYTTEKEGADAYDMFVVHNSHDEFRELNFPEKKSEYLERVYIPLVFKIKKRNTYYGVNQEKNKYRVAVRINGKKTHIGMADDILTAAKMYDEYVINNDIPNRKLNFPSENPNYDPRIIKTLYEVIDDKTIRLICDNNLKDNKVLIDMVDYEDIKYFIWYVNNNGYVFGCINNKKILLSRYLFNVTDPKIYVDHINNDPLDNRQSNLRLSNPSKNAQNKKKRANTSSNYIGVYLKYKKWNSYVTYDKIWIYIGRDKKEKHAAKRRDIFILDNYPDEHYKLNFNNWFLAKIIKWKKKLNIELKYREKILDIFDDVQQYLKNDDIQNIEPLNNSLKKIYMDRDKKESKTLGN